jgi:hypothetical protein
MSWECSTNGIGNSYKILVRKPEGKRPTGRHRKPNIAMDLKGKWCKGVSGNHQPQDRVLWWVHGKEIFGSMKDCEFFDQLSEY